MEQRYRALTKDGDSERSHVQRFFAMPLDWVAGPDLHGEVTHDEALFVQEGWHVEDDIQVFRSGYVNITSEVKDYFGEVAQQGSVLPIETRALLRFIGAMRKMLLIEIILIPVSFALSSLKWQVVALVVITVALLVFCYIKLFIIHDLQSGFECQFQATNPNSSNGTIDILVLCEDQQTLEFFEQRVDTALIAQGVRDEDLSETRPLIQVIDGEGKMIEEGELEEPDKLAFPLTFSLAFTLKQPDAQRTPKDHNAIVHETCELLFRKNWHADLSDYHCSLPIPGYFCLLLKSLPSIVEGAMTSVSLPPLWRAWKRRSQTSFAEAWHEFLFFLPNAWLPWFPTLPGLLTGWLAVSTAMQLWMALKCFREARTSLIPFTFYIGNSKFDPDALKFGNIAWHHCTNAAGAGNLMLSAAVGESVQDATVAALPGSHGDYSNVMHRSDSVVSKLISRGFITSCPRLFLKTSLLAYTYEELEVIDRIDLVLAIATGLFTIVQFVPKLVSRMQWVYNRFAGAMPGLERYNMADEHLRIQWAETYGYPKTNPIPSWWRAFCCPNMEPMKTGGLGEGDEVPSITTLSGDGGAWALLCLSSSLLVLALKLGGVWACKSHVLNMLPFPHCWQ